MTTTRASSTRLGERKRRYRQRERKTQSEKIRKKGMLEVLKLNSLLEIFTHFEFETSNIPKRWHKDGQGDVY